MSRLSLLVPALLALVALGCSCGCAGSSRNAPSAAGQPATTRESTSSRRLTDLRDIGQLRTLFNSASGEPRLIILVSPT
jgi:hypothetical protein